MSADSAVITVIGLCWANYRLSFATSQINDYLAARQLNISALRSVTIQTGPGYSFALISLLGFGLAALLNYSCTFFDECDSLQSASSTDNNIDTNQLHAINTVDAHGQLRNDIDRAHRHGHLDIDRERRLQTEFDFPYQTAHEPSSHQDHGVTQQFSALTMQRKMQLNMELASRMQLLAEFEKKMHTQSNSRAC